MREHWLASRYKAANDFVFANTLGRGLEYRDSVKASAKPSSAPNCTRQETLHSLRHTFASLLIARRLDVVFVSRQLGHANPSITLKVYAHLYARADHAETARDAIDASYTAMATAAGAD